MGDVDELKKSMKSNMNNTKSSIFSEMNQRELRKANVVIHGLEEPHIEGASSKEAYREKEDETLSSLIDQMSLNSTEVIENVKFRRRLGQKKENVVRPLLIGFKNVNERNLVMETAMKQDSLRVSFTSDLTKMQREENDKLRKEVQHLNSQRPTDESGDFRWKLVGPPEMLQKAKTRKIAGWETNEKRRRLKQQQINQLNAGNEDEEEEEEA